MKRSASDSHSHDGDNHENQKAALRQSAVALLTVALSKEWKLYQDVDEHILDQDKRDDQKQWMNAPFGEQQLDPVELAQYCVTWANYQNLLGLGKQFFAEHLTTTKGKMTHGHSLVYLSKGQCEEHRLVFGNDGKLYYGGQVIRDGKFIFVHAANNAFYVYVPQSNQKGAITDIYHHSSFTAGGNVYSAGAITVKDGKIVKIKNKSGHYKPSPKHLQQTVSVVPEKYFSNDAVISCIDVVGNVRVTTKYSREAFLQADLEFSAPMCEPDTNSDVYKMATLLVSDQLLEAALDGYVALAPVKEDSVSAHVVPSYPPSLVGSAAALAAFSAAVPPKSKIARKFCFDDDVSDDELDTPVTGAAQNGSSAAAAAAVAAAEAAASAAVGVGNGGGAGAAGATSVNGVTPERASSLYKKQHAVWGSPISPSGTDAFGAGAAGRGGAAGAGRGNGGGRRLRF